MITLRLKKANLSKVALEYIEYTNPTWTIKFENVQEAPKSVGAQTAQNPTLKA